MTSKKEIEIRKEIEIIERDLKYLRELNKDDMQGTATWWKREILYAELEVLKEGRAEVLNEIKKINCYKFLHGDYFDDEALIEELKKRFGENETPLSK